MKKIYLSFFTVVLALSANAQLSLTKAANEPVIGDITTRHGYDTLAVLPKSTGANQVWDFSALTTNTVVEVSTYTTVASTPSASTFPSATLAEDDGQGAYTYSKATATQYELVGIVDPNLTLNFAANTAIAAIWPVTMGYTNTDTFSGSASSGTATGTAAGTITTVASGTGTLIIPGGPIFTNVLQVKMDQHINLSLVFGLFTATVVSTDYNYYHSSQKFPLLTVSYSDIQGALTSNTGVVKVNNSVILGVTDLNFDATFNVFPNPAKNNFNVKLQNASNANCTVDIVNAIGQTVQTNNLGNDSEILNTISISNLTSGIYMIKTTLGDKVSNRKLIVE